MLVLNAGKIWVWIFRAHACTCTYTCKSSVCTCACRGRKRECAQGSSLAPLQRELQNDLHTSNAAKDTM